MSTHCEGDTPAHWKVNNIMKCLHMSLPVLKHIHIQSVSSLHLNTSKTEQFMFPFRMWFSAFSLFWLFLTHYARCVVLLAMSVLWCYWLCPLCGAIGYIRCVVLLAVCCVVLLAMVFQKHLG